MRVLPLVATLCLVAVGGCDSAVQQVALNVTLLNESTGPIHILGPDEDFNPGNQVAAGNSRFVEVFIQPITSSSRAPREFRAGRNGTVYDEVDCINRTDDGSEDFRVVYLMTGELACRGW